MFGKTYNMANIQEAQWAYKKAIIIDNTANVNILTDYQIRLDLTSANFDFTLANSDGSDIRFTDSDGITLIDSWIENWNAITQTATLWTKVPLIPISSTVTIYLYYGNNVAITTSSYPNTFSSFIQGLSPKLWLNANNLAYTNGQSVPTWKDDSGNGGDLTQATTVNQPIYETNSMNGFPVVRFTPTQYLNNVVNYPSPFTVIYVSKLNGGTNARVMSAVNNNWLMGYWSGYKNRAYYSGWVLKSGAAADTSKNIYTGSSTGATSYFYGNGVLLANNAGGVTGPNGMGLNYGYGGSERSDTDVAEVLAFNSVLSTFDQQVLERNLGAKYGISTTNTLSEPVLSVGAQEIITKENARRMFLMNI